ncbi:MAG TPA: GNAT family N-acetyltransferase, partial [Acidimicrobiales bacterium]|nr:GNAT family N-acetyltransferase [Acidimicrobiales bacterium]
MSWKAVPMEPGERGAIASLLTTVFGRGPEPSDDIRRQLDLLLEPDRMFVVHDGPAVVGSGGAYTFDLALPGGSVLPMQAISEVGVVPTHRRRGILREVMRSVVDQAVERGEPLAGLTASEATIYRRFGFGAATRFQSLSIDSRRLQLAEARVGDAGVGREAAGAAPRLQLASAAEASSVMPDLWARSFRRSPGELSRSPSYWAAIDVDPEEDRDGGTARFVVLHRDPAGEPDGAASYRLQWRSGSAGEHVLAVEDVVATSDAVETVLLRYLLD